MKGWTEQNKNGEDHVGLPRFAAGAEARRKKLEADPQAELQLPGVIALLVDHAEVRYVVRGRTEAGIKEHRVIEHVVGDELELGINPLPDLDVLGHPHVHIPVRQTADHRPVAASSLVQAQNRRTNGGEKG